MNKILVIAEHDHTSISDATKSVITAAKQLNGSIHLLIAGDAVDKAANDASYYEDIETIKIISHQQLKHSIAEPLSEVIVQIAADYDYILAPSNTFGKDFMPRVAALLDIAQISDVIAILSEDTFKHPIYAGNVIETVKSLDKQKILTIRTTAFDKAEKNEQAATVESLDITVSNSTTEFIEKQETESERPELTSARIVISGGRGMGSGDNFALIEAVADKLGAAIGASRAAVDAGYVPNDWQVGQTGKVVAPELYIAVGISGAIQHLAGMKDSKIIVAINNDENAPIFEVADYGLVKDLFDVLPEMEKLLS